MTTDLTSSVIPSHSGPWRNRRTDDDTVHCYPVFGPKHRLEWHCWCHPMIELFNDGQMVLHNVAQ